MARTVAFSMPTSAQIKQQTPAKDFVPSNFAEMYQHYYVYVLRLLVQQGIERQDAEDVAQILFIKMDEKGLLERFDPEHGTTGQPAVFTTLLSGFVLKYMRHYKHRQLLARRREPQYLDAPRTEGIEGTGKADSSYSGPWIDVYGPHFEDEYTELTDTEFRVSVRAHLATASTGRKDSQLDLVALFDEIDRQVEMDGKYSTTELMSVFSVTRTTIHNWLEKLRVEVAKAVEAHG
ncbi:DNA binding protein [Microbacterium phage Magritte]|nr:DNA binding protein [Microbacterium phage Magritte]